MAGNESSYTDITWVLCVPDPGTPNRIVPYLHRKRGTVWFSEPQYIDRFMREHPSLPPGARSRAVVGRERLLKFAGDLVRAGVDTLYYDLEYGKDTPGRSLSKFAQQLQENPTASGVTLEDSSSARSIRFRVPTVRKPG
jgi:hypothetical protein